VLALPALQVWKLWHLLSGPERTQARRRFDQNRPLAIMLPDYFDRYAEVVGQSAVEWHLAERALTEPAHPVEVPDALLHCNSGSALTWALRQRWNRPGGLPGRLARFPNLSPSQARLCAWAWALWPENPEISAGSMVQWLSRWPGALAWLAVGQMKSGNADEVALRWIPEILAQDSQLLAELPEVAAAQGLLEPAIALASDLRASLTRFAFRAHSYPAALQGCEHLAGPEWEDVRVASLAACGETEAAVAEYCRSWLGSQRAFPYPHYLLRRLTRLEDKPIRDHLLSTGALHEAPQWARLECEEGRGVSTLERWIELRALSPRDPYLLVGLTEAVLAAGPQCPPNVREELQGYWEALAGAEPWVQPAHSALLLLDRSHDSRVQRYMRHLAGQPVGYRLAPGRADVRAVRLCAEALMFQRRWPELVDLWEGTDRGLLRGVSSFEEFTLLRVLVSLERTGTWSDEALPLWQDLVGLPLSVGQLHFALELFNTACREARMRGVTLDSRWEDLSLQWLRRGQAQAEYLSRKLGRCTARLERVGLTSLPGILEDLERNFGGD